MEARQIKILLSGASGFIGSHLAGLLIEKGYRLSILTRNKKNIENHHWANRVSVIEGDITNAKQMLECCRNQYLIIHLAGLAHAGSLEQLHTKINFEGTQNILNGAIKAKAEKFIYISSSKAKTGSSPYGEAKLKAEQLVLSAHNKGDILACCLRPTAVYGQGMKGNLAGWIKAIKRGRVPVLPALETRIAMIGLADLCTAIVLAVECEEINGKSYELSDGKVYKIKEIENEIRLSLGVGSGVLQLPKWSFYLAASMGDVVKLCLGVNIGFNKAGYRTLFIDEFSQSMTFTDDSGFKAEQNFYHELKSIIAEQ